MGTRKYKSTGHKIQWNDKERKKEKHFHTEVKGLITSEFGDAWGETGMGTYGVMELGRLRNRDTTQVLAKYRAFIAEINCTTYSLYCIPLYG